MRMGGGVDVSDKGRIDILAIKNDSSRKRFPNCKYARNRYSTCLHVSAEH
jgi:hypothetical protein